MTVVKKVQAYNRFVQDSFQNASGAVQRVHQTAAEIPVELLELAGLPPEWCERLKKTHGDFIDILYSSVCSAHGEVGQLVVDQVENMVRLADELGLSDPEDD